MARLVTDEIKKIFSTDLMMMYMLSLNTATCNFRMAHKALIINRLT